MKKKKELKKRRKHFKDKLKFEYSKTKSLPLKDIGKLWI
jgi:hypothetical protein